MRRWLAAVMAAAVLGGMPHAHAQTFPSRPITLIVPFAAGGPLDAMARILSERMRVSLGQPVIIEIVTGAGGSIGFGRVARAAPDGYTFGLGMWSTHVVNGVIYNLPYDVRSDFEPISLLVQNADLIVGKSALPADDLKGLIAWLKANPDKATWGTQGVGGPSHVGGILFQQLTGTRFGFVPYRGARARHAGPGRRPDRSRAAAARHRAAAGPRRQDQGLCGDGEEPARRRARHSNRGRGRAARVLLLGLDGVLGAEGHAEGRDREAQRRRRGEPRRSGGARALQPSSDRRCSRASSRRRKRLPPCTRPRSRNGGRSSRPRTSKANEEALPI